MLLHLKVTLLAIFLLSTLLGLAATNRQALLIGIAALGVALVIALASALMIGRKHERELHSSF